MEERLQKILARAGYGSRRSSEVLIESGRVAVNGKQASLGMKADPQMDRITVDGRPIKLPEELLYIALYKPRGVISAVSSPDPRPNVKNLVPIEAQLYPVGRLDVDSEGLILMTNDGELANRLTHPRYEHEKEYRVLVARKPDEKQLETWRRGVVLEDGYKTQPAQVRLDSLFGKGAWLRVILKEGHKRQIREMGRQTGLPVVRIIRIRIGSLQLGGMKPRDWRHLSEGEVEALKGKTVKTDLKPRRTRSGSDARKSARSERSKSERRPRRPPEKGKRR
jgi:23S rRNA pseudouridine2605 synthase